MTGPSALSFSTRPARRRWVKVVVAVLVVAAVLAVLAGLTAGSLWAYAWFRLGAEPVASLDEDAIEALDEDGATAPDGTFTAVVALVEDRDPTEPGEPPMIGSVALVQTGGPRGDDAAVVMLPTGLRVAVDGSDPMPLREVHETGGADLLVRAVVDHTGIAVDHLLIADTEAIPRLVESVGELEVCAPACELVDGDAARGQVATFVDAAGPAEVEASFARLAATSAAVAEQVSTRRIVLSPLASRRAVDVLADRVTTDVSLRGGVVVDVAERLARVGEVAVATLPGVVNPDSGRLLVLPEQAEIRFALLRDGGMLETDAEDDGRAILADAQVSVQNGTGTAGYAADIEATLTASGVQVVGTENAASFDVSRTVLRYAGDDPTAEVVAVLLADVLGGDVELDPVDQVPTFEGDPVTVAVIGGADLEDEVGAT